MRFKFSKKSISSVIALVLLLVVAIIAVVLFKTWYDNYSSDIFGDVEFKTSDKGVIDFKGFFDGFVYINNNKSDNLSVDFLIDGNPCDIGNLSSGLNSYNISHCYDKFESSKPKFSVITSDSVSEKTVFIKNYDEILSEVTEEFIINYSTPFITKWDTSIEGSSGVGNLTLPLVENGDYHFNVSWGDGSSDLITSWNQSETLHIYSFHNVYEVNISGKLKGWNFGYYAFKSNITSKIIEVNQWGDLILIDSLNLFDGFFQDCYNLKNITSNDVLNLSIVTDLTNLFRDCFNLENINKINDWDISNVRSLAGVFNDASKFNQSLDKWNVSNVRDMHHIFYGATNFNQDISGWEVHNVTAMYYMFHDAASFNQNISGWNVSKVTNMGSMFNGARSFNQNLTDWNVSSVIYCSDFYKDTDSWIDKENKAPQFTECSVN